jgi:hypothetical protein
MRLLGCHHKTASLEEHGEAYALLVKAVSDPDRQAANQVLEELASAFHEAR